ncbi:uncharacterized protein LOC110048571 [Orbicella faveolata]|uniref:uncharacterized protein LOC110048571 n=1 Tax=Orbicella faveolata TaxID=48498 RepID=UPI0009E5333F|nr:uncharacterized protein LOC110048571 [Orbicella faveolata]XP_020610012.1 uncharacterized protein LOC110048571 [Orbicella faveolata]
MMNPSDSQEIDSASNDTLREPVDTAQEQSSSQNMDLADNDTLTQTAKVYKELGDAELAKEEFQNALSFYTEGINVKCKDDQLNIELYRCRWLSNCHLGNVHEAFEDLNRLQEITGTVDTTNNEATLIPKMESDDDTLRETAQVYKELGEVEYDKGEFQNALSLFTQVIDVKCKDDQLNAQLYFARSNTHSALGESVICCPL